MADTNNKTNTVSRPGGNRSFNGVNHLKLATSDIWKCHDFYTKILPFTPLPQYNHYTPDHKLFAVMFEHTPTKLIVEARYEPNQAKLQEAWDPVTWGVGTRKDLEQWAAWLDANQIKRSKILVGIKGWWLACEDPDRRHVRLYVDDEEHEWQDPERDEYWLRNLVADPKCT